MFFSSVSCHAIPAQVKKGAADERICAQEKDTWSSPRGAGAGGGCGGWRAVLPLTHSDSPWGNHVTPAAASVPRFRLSHSLMGLLHVISPEHFCDGTHSSDTGVERIRARRKSCGTSRRFFLFSSQPSRPSSFIPLFPVGSPLVHNSSLAVLFPALYLLAVSPLGLSLFCYVCLSRSVCLSVSLSLLCACL